MTRFVVVRRKTSRYGVALLGSAERDREALKLCVVGARGNLPGGHWTGTEQSRTRLQNPKFKLIIGRDAVSKVMRTRYLLRCLCIVGPMGERL